MVAQAGWHEDSADPSRLRYWDGSRWTDHYTPKPPLPSGEPHAAPSAPGRSGEETMIPIEQVAHDLAIAYINNRYGIRVIGEFSVDSTRNYEMDVVQEVTGEGSVSTELLPDLDDPETVRVGTGERHLFGLGPEKTRLVHTGAYEIDGVLRNMINDYYKAYARILELLTRR